MSNFTIYTIGDIDFVYTAFNGIALIFSTTAQMNGSNLLNMLQQLDFSINQCVGTCPTKTDVPIFCWIMGLLFYSIPSLKPMSRWNR
jgi:conjugal transfer mating pair stabilization protein TraG